MVWVGGIMCMYVVWGLCCTYSTLNEGPNGKLWDLCPQARSDAERVCWGGASDRGLSLTGLTYIPPHLLNREREIVIGRYTRVFCA